MIDLKKTEINFLQSRKEYSFGSESSSSVDTSLPFGSHIHRLLTSLEKSHSYGSSDQRMKELQQEIQYLTSLKIDSFEYHTKEWIFSTLDPIIMKSFVGFYPSNDSSCVMCCSTN